jgi:hypothetical protein
MRLELILSCLVKLPPAYRHLALTCEGSPRLTEAEDWPLYQMPPIFWMRFHPWWSQERQHPYTTDEPVLIWERALSDITKLHVMPKWVAEGVLQKYFVERHGEH